MEKSTAAALQHAILQTYEKDTNVMFYNMGASSTQIFPPGVRILKRFGEKNLVAMRLMSSQAIVYSWGGAEAIFKNRCVKMSVLFLEQSWAFRAIDFDFLPSSPPPPPNTFPKLSLAFSSK